jgi:hypothetical protein
MPDNANDDLKEKLTQESIMVAPVLLAFLLRLRSSFISILAAGWNIDGISSKVLFAAVNDAKKERLIKIVESKGNNM